MHPTKTQISQGICMKKAWVLSYPLSAQQRLIRLGGCPGWSESSLGTHHFVGFVMLQLILKHYLFVISLWGLVQKLWVMSSCSQDYQDYKPHNSKLLKYDRKQSYGLGYQSWKLLKINLTLILDFSLCSIHLKFFLSSKQVAIFYDSCDLDMWKWQGHYMVTENNWAM